MSIGIRSFKMEYKFTFQDGSEALAHYGVKGMKWGVWNSETRARYQGAGNGTYFKKATHGSEYGKAVTNLRRAYNANQPKAKQVAKVLLLGPGHAHAYNTARSRGLSRADALQNSTAGFLYAQGVKHKQKKLGTTEPKVSKAAKERSEYTKDESLKKTALKYVLMPSYYSSTAYNSVKARTKSRGKAALAAIGVGAASLPIQLAGSVGAAAAPGVAMPALTSLSSLGILGTQAAVSGAIGRRGGRNVQVSAPKFKTRVPETKKNGKQRR